MTLSKTSLFKLSQREAGGMAVRLPRLSLRDSKVGGKQASPPFLLQNNTPPIPDFQRAIGRDSRLVAFFTSHCQPKPALPATQRHLQCRNKTPPGTLFRKVSRFGLCSCHEYDWMPYYEPSTYSFLAATVSAVRVATLGGTAKTHAQSSCLLFVCSWPMAGSSDGPVVPANALRTRSCVPIS